MQLESDKQLHLSAPALYLLDQFNHEGRGDFVPPGTDRVRFGGGQIAWTIELIQAYGIPAIKALNQTSRKYLNDGFDHFALTCDELLKPSSKDVRFYRFKDYTIHTAEFNPLFDFEKVEHHWNVGDLANVLVENPSSDTPLSDRTTLVASVRAQFRYVYQNRNTSSLLSLQPKDQYTFSRHAFVLYGKHTYAPNQTNFLGSDSNFSQPMTVSEDNLRRIDLRTSVVVRSIERLDGRASVYSLQKYQEMCQSRRYVDWFSELKRRRSKRFSRKGSVTFDFSAWIESGSFDFGIRVYDDDKRILLDNFVEKFDQEHFVFRASDIQEPDLKLGIYFVEIVPNFIGKPMIQKLLIQ